MDDLELLKGNRVRLAPLTPQDLPVLAGWQLDTVFLRLFDADPAYPRGEHQLAKWLEEHQKPEKGFLFGIRMLADGALLGVIELDGILWTHGNAWFSIGLGDAAHWGQGLGQEAAGLALGFAFRELNLHRVQLTVFAYNQRAIALYERLGFTREGTFREFLHRDGQRYDMYLYGILRHEWEAPAG